MGFDFWDHDPAQASTRITIRHNVAIISGIWCWALMNATASSATDNLCITAPGSKYAATGYPIGAGVTVSGNVNGAKP